MFESQVCSFKARRKLKTVFMRDVDVALSEKKKTQKAQLQLWYMKANADLELLVDSSRLFTALFFYAKWCVNLFGIKKIKSGKIQLIWLTKKCKMKWQYDINRREPSKVGYHIDMLTIHSRRILKDGRRKLQYLKNRNSLNRKQINWLKGAVQTLQLARYM